jgi:hypothetical protein
VLIPEHHPGFTDWQTYEANQERIARNTKPGPHQEEEIIAALTAKPHALQVARDTGWSFATVWRRAESAGIELTAGREAKGYKRLPAEEWRKIAQTIAKNPKATQQPAQEVAQATGVSRSTGWSTWPQPPPLPASRRLCRLSGAPQRPHRPLEVQFASLGLLQHAVEVAARRRPEMMYDSRKARHDYESPSGKTGFHISNWCVASCAPPLTDHSQQLLARVLDPWRQNLRR